MHNDGKMWKPNRKHAFKMPHDMAIERAVFTLSPVTMRTVMPDRWHFRIASGTSGRTGSWMPTMHRQVKSLTSSSSSTRSLGPPVNSIWFDSALAGTRSLLG